MITSIKIRLFEIIAALVCMLNGCEWVEGPVDRPDEEQEYEKGGVVLQYSMTVNGIDLSYVIDDSELPHEYTDDGIWRISDRF